MGTKKRVNGYPRAFQLTALERMKNCESISALAEGLRIHRMVLYHLGTCSIRKTSSQVCTLQCAQDNKIVVADCISPGVTRRIDASPDWLPRSPFWPTSG